MNPGELLGAILGAIGPQAYVAKIRLKNRKKDGGKAIGILLKDGHPIDGFPGDMIGLTSLEQLKNLKASGIPYETIKEP